MSESVWLSEFYLEKYEHLLSYLEPDAARSKAKSHRMISQVQWGKLVDLAGQPYSHNETLLRHLEKRPEAFPCLVEIVRAQGDSDLAGYLERALRSHPQTLPAVPSIPPPSLEVRNLSHDRSGNLYTPAAAEFLRNEAPAAHREHSQSQSQQPLPAGASSGPGSIQTTFEVVPTQSDQTPRVISELDQIGGMPPSSSADRQDQTRQRNPWESSEYLQWYHKLVEILHPSQVKNLCFSLQLLDKYEMQDIDAKLTQHARNSAILAVLSSSPEKFGRFREVLHHLNSLGLEGIVKDLDKLGPDREKDQDCLKARRTLEKY